MKKELTYEERYNIKLKLVVDDFSCEYYKCGSHKLEIIAHLGLEELQELYNSIKKIKGLNK